MSLKVLSVKVGDRVRWIGHNGVHFQPGHTAVVLVKTERPYEGLSYTLRNEMTGEVSDDWLLSTHYFAHCRDPVDILIKEVSL